MKKKKKKIQKNIFIVRGALRIITQKQITIDGINPNVEKKFQTCFILYSNV